MPVILWEMFSEIPTCPAKFDMSRSKKTTNSSPLSFDMGIQICSQIAASPKNQTPGY